VNLFPVRGLDPLMDASRAVAYEVSNRAFVGKDNPVTAMKSMEMRLAQVRTAR